MSIPKELYQSYINSGPWEIKRFERMALDEYKCADCGAKHNRTHWPDESEAPVPLQVHHLRYDNLGQEPMEDLITLCAFCHQGIHLFMHATKCKPEASEAWIDFRARLHESWLKHKPAAEDE